MPSVSPGLADGQESFDDFRITSATEISATLQRLVDSGVVLNLSTPSGAALSSALWTIDATRGVLSFSADATSPQLSTLSQSSEAMVVGYLDSVKVKFDVRGLTLEHNGKTTTVRCGIPGEIFRFQRRDYFRVRPLLRSEPVARFRHPSLPDTQLSLRVLDVSMGGCALLLPPDGPTLEPGLLGSVELELDADTRITVPLYLHHLSTMAVEGRGMKLGCEFHKASNESLRVLQRYIDQTQKKRKMMALD
jgi:c-di-GMP-binding flagellar brake protein YcgR